MFVYARQDLQILFGVEGENPGGFPLRYLKSKGFQFKPKTP